MSGFVVIGLCAIVIYFACEYFVNGVEWVGLRLGVAKSAVGSVLAAFGTALPETVVTFAAVATGGSAAEKSIGVGAAVGGPLVLATIAYGVVGATWLSDRSRGDKLNLDLNRQAKLATDQLWFLVIFALIFALGLVDSAPKRYVGIALLIAYAVYTWREVRGGESSEGAIEQPEPLRISPGTAEPTLFMCGLQTVIALAAISAASTLFVHELGSVSAKLGFAPETVALFLSPVATELPETLNAFIWLRQGKTSLAMGNIAGAMVIQSTIPSALGLLYTPWLFDRVLVWAALVTMVAVIALWLQLRRAALSARGLALLGGLYFVFIALAWWY